MFYFTTLVVALAVVSASAGNVRMESSVNQFSSPLWLKEKSLKDTDLIKAIFVLKHEENSIKNFERTLLDISSPKSANYGKFLKV
jgi:Cu2+-containing amine oxidase